MKIKRSQRYFVFLIYKWEPGIVLRVSGNHSWCFPKYATPFIFLLQFSIPSLFIPYLVFHNHQHSFFCLWEVSSETECAPLQIWSWIDDLKWRRVSISSKKLKEIYSGALEVAWTQYWHLLNKNISFPGIMQPLCNSSKRLSWFKEVSQVALYSDSKHKSSNSQTFE